MKSPVYISKKEEIYTYHELDFIYQQIDKNAFSELSRKLLQLKNSLNKNKENSAIFFMPKKTFDIFSIFQISAPLPQITLNDCGYLLQALDKNSVPVDEYSEKLKLHLIKKIRTLQTFLLQENTVNSTITQADNLEQL